MKDKSFFRSINIFSMIIVLLACSMWGHSLNSYVHKSSISALTDSLGISSSASRVVDAITLQMLGASPIQKGKTVPGRTGSRNQLLWVIISLTKIAILGFEAGAIYRMILLFRSYSGHLDNKIRKKIRSDNPISRFMMKWPPGFINPREKSIDVYAEHINGSPGESLYSTGNVLSKKPALFRIIFKARVFLFLSGSPLFMNISTVNNALDGGCR